MALSGRELLLIVRAQNQASQALRRVAGDMQKLGSIRDMHYRQNQLAINQSNIMRQRQRALNELQSIENTNGARNIAMQKRKITNRAQELAAMNSLQRAQIRAAAMDRRGVTGPARTMAGRDVERYTHQLNAAKVAATQLAAAEGQMAQRASILRSEIATANQRLAQNALQMREIDKAIRVQRWEKLRTGASIATHFGRVMQMAGLVAAAGVAILAHSAAQFNTEATLVATQTGKIGSGFTRIAANSKFLQTALLGVMAQSTATRQEITQAAYDIYSSLNISLGGGVKLLKTFSKASIAGMTPLNDVTQAGITVMNDFGIKVDQMPKIMQRMFAAVRFGRMTFAEFVGTMSQTVPAFAAAGQSFDTLAGAMAFLTRRMPNVRMAGTALARMMEIMGRKEFVQGAKEFGVRITDVHNRLLPLPQVIDRLIKRFPKLKTGGTFLQNFFKMITAGKDQKGGLTGTIQARRAFTFLVLGQKAYHDIAGKTINDNNEFSRSFAAMSQTAGVKWAIFMNRLKAFAITLGAAMLPALLKLSEPLQKAVDWFTHLDKAQRDTFSKYAVYVAAILLVGGSIISVGGMILSFIAILGKLGIAGTGLTVGILAVVAAVKILRGEWQSLGDVADSFSSTMLGSVQGFVAMSALITVAALRMRKAITGLSLTMGLAGAGAGGAGGGMFRGIGKALGLGATAAGVARLEGAGRLSAGLKGAAFAAAALPGPLKIAAGAIGLAAAAAGLWKLHMQGVAEHSARIERFNQMVQNVGAAPVVQARRLGGLGLDVRDVLKQKLAVADLNAQIKTLRGSIASASAADRPSLQRELMGLTLQRADAVDVLRSSNERANSSFNAMSGFINRQVNLFQTLGNAHKNLTRERAQLQQTYQRMLENPTAALAYTNTINRLRSGISNLQGEIRQLGPAANRNAGILQTQFTRVVRSLQEIGQLPKKVSATSIQALIGTAIKRGRMLTLPEMRAVIKAVADPSSLRKMPQDIQAAVRKAKVTIKIQTDTAAARKAAPNFKKIFGNILPALKIAPKVDAKATSGTRGKIASVFKKTIIQRVIVPLQPGQAQAVALGASIAAGIASGINSGIPAVAAAGAAAVNAAIAAAHAAAGKPKSPSPRTRDEIGIPLGQGITAGILSQLGLIEKSSRLAVDAFNGPWLTSDKFTRAKKKVHVHVRDIIKDLQMQVAQMRLFNNSLERLAARGVPLALLDQLSQLGVEGAKNIAKLAGATDAQLRKYVRIWRQAMHEIRRSTRSNFDTIVSDLHNMMDQAAHTLLDKWNEIRDGLKSVWGDIFSGFDDKIGEGFKNAMDTWQNNMDDLLKQVDDLNQQLLDIQEQTRQKMNDEFGQLFQGAFLASDQVQTKLQWGQILNIDDLTRDLQSQLDAFNSWRGDLANLAGKVPADMLKELMDLGPSAAGMIKALANSSGPELQNYVNLWLEKQKIIKAAMGDTLPDKEEFRKQIDELLKQINNLFKQINDLKNNKPQPLTPQDLIDKLQKDAFDQIVSNDLIRQLRKKGLPAELLSQLAQMGPDALPMLIAFNNMTKEQLAAYIKSWQEMQNNITKETKGLMNDQIALWKQHGADIAAGIIAGVMSEQEALLKFFRKLFMNLLKEARKETKANSPSLVFKALGSDMVSGLAQGLAEAADLRMPIPGMGNAYMNGGGYNRRNPAPIAMTVNAHQNESLMSTMERASFRLRHRPV